MFTSPYPLELSVGERAELEAMSRSRTIANALAQRARVILAIADGEPYPVLCTRLALSPTTLTRWRKRFERSRVAGLHDAARSGRGDRLSPALEARILALTHQPPPAAKTHWTTRTLGARLGISHMTVARAWRRAGLKPHRLERYVASPDPDFERKAADIIGLYLRALSQPARACGRLLGR
jgi:transposase